MNRMMRIAPVAIVLTLVFGFAAPALVASAQDDKKMTMEELKALIATAKKEVVKENLALTAGEETAFWPIYDAYQTDLARINERTKTAILAYATAYNAGPIGDAQAKSLVDEAFAIDKDLFKMRESHKKNLFKAIPPAKAARYLQIENKIRAVINYELADAIPLVE